jgi:hypothetical protein
MRRIMAAVGAVALLTGVASAAAAAPPVNAEIAVQVDGVRCLGNGDVEVTGSATSDVDLTWFNVGVWRWELVTASSVADFHRFDGVEHWGADFHQRKREPAIPAEFTLITTDDIFGTWEHHAEMDPNFYDPGHLGSEYFVVSVGAGVSGKRNTEGTSVWEEWVVDCNDLKDPALFISPMDVEWIGDGLG